MPLVQVCAQGAGAVGVRQTIATHVLGPFGAFPLLLFDGLDLPLKIQQEVHAVPQLAASLSVIFNFRLQFPFCLFQFELPPLTGLFQFPQTKRFQESLLFYV